MQGGNKIPQISIFLSKYLAFWLIIYYIVDNSTPTEQIYKQLKPDAIHDTVHEMARDEARHGKAFKGLLERYFGK